MFARRQRQRCFSHGKPASAGVEGKGSAGYRLIEAGAAAAQLGADAGLQFFGVERLDQIIVGSAVEAPHPARNGIVGGEDDHRR